MYYVKKKVMKMNTKLSIIIIGMLLMSFSALGQVVFTVDAPATYSAGQTDVPILIHIDPQGDYLGQAGFTMTASPSSGVIFKSGTQTVVDFPQMSDYSCSDPSFDLTTPTQWDCTIILEGVGDGPNTAGYLVRFFVDISPTASGDITLNTAIKTNSVQNDVGDPLLFVAPGSEVMSQVVVCTPDCDNKYCGDNGCGGSCGTCSGSLHCDTLGQCVNTCAADAECFARNECIQGQCDPILDEIRTVLKTVDTEYTLLQRISNIAYALKLFFQRISFG